MTISASAFHRILVANVDNLKMSDADFREFVRNTLPTVEQSSTVGTVYKDRVRSQSDSIGPANIRDFDEHGTIER